MKKISLLLLCFLFLGSTLSFSQKKYEANWESIDSRPVPEWFQKAKFGIFIHWGLYSVPAWSPKGSYEEWYQSWLQQKHIFGNGKFTGKEVVEFHNKKYGKDFTYYDFPKLFKAELYNPQEWAEVFKKSGAKYVILTSKHHDGYCLWPNKQAGEVRNLPWNSMESGPRRDLVGDYVKAVREAGLKAGLYYSLYEWYHPWYKNNFNDFVDKHFHPQFKDLVTRYAPDLIYADGEWDHSGKDWKSPQLLSWLYNESPCKDYVVINDRWSAGDRHKHGGYYSTEYEVDGIKGNHPWEENRGMGLSFGYNRAENLEDYSSARALTLMLVDIVSMGGNLCLNIGPSGDGAIPVIMQERLLQIGEWLKINGEAIYGTTKWNKPCQWSKGSKNNDFKKGKSYVEGEYIIKQTIDPEPGNAVKEMFFTQKDKALYAIVPKWPVKKLVIKDVKPSAGAKITILGLDKKLKWKYSKGNLIIEVPTFNPNWKLSDFAYSFKISSVK